MSKPITAAAAMMLYEEGMFQLTDPVDEFVPEFAELTVLGEDGVIRPAENKMTMQQLLSHTTGLSYGFDPNDVVDRMYGEANLWQSKDLDELTEKIAKIPLKFEPGARWHYSVAVDITGLIVERLSGLSFDVFLKERMFDPLGMEDTFFNVPADKMDRFLPNHTWDAENESLVQLESDDFVQYTDETLFSGGGGLVSTAMDYLRFSEMMRRGGELDGVRLLSPKTVDYMAMNHLPGALTAGGVGERPAATLDGQRVRLRARLRRIDRLRGDRRAQFRRRVQLGRGSGHAVLDRPCRRRHYDRHDPTFGFTVAAALRNEGADLPGAHGDKVAARS